ncbi:MAG: hypothetical protein J5695_05810 [Bacteroidales bacterium]|nr:hypothetical protein [Bacteroidales bacterium]MBO4566723.1 hypothetical protein [Bacteroidales bacterium]
MATLTNEEIQELQQQLKEKKDEINAIYDKLAEAGVVTLPDDYLDTVAGGNPYRHTVRPLPPSPTPIPPAHF